MLTQSRILFLVALAVACGSAAVAQAQQNTLRWSMSQGQKFAVEIDQSINQVMNVPNQGEMEIPMNQLIELTWEVKGVEGDKYQIEQMVDRIKMTMDSPMMQIEFDTDEGEAEGVAGQIQDVVKPMIGAAVSFTMDARGNITEIEIPEEIESAMAAAGRGMAGQFLSSDMLEQMIQQSGVKLPEEAVSQGSSWSDSMTQENNMMTMTINSKYTYQGEVDQGGMKLHKIGVDSEIDLEATEGLPGGGSVDIEDQKSSGEILFDNNAGHLAGSKSTQEMTMVISAGGQTIDMVSTTNVSLKFTPVTEE